jgi:hypothetical protein
MKSQIIGKGTQPILHQPPKFKDIPLTFCSYFCEGYRKTYGDREGVIFETDFPIVYACPVDTFELLRDGNWLPGHEQFLFDSIESMLKKYPSIELFVKDFQNFFKSLKPEEVYPNSFNSKELIELRFRTDYCLHFPYSWQLGCNEITFRKPLSIKNPKIFQSKQDLINIYEEQ